MESKFVPPNDPILIRVAKEIPKDQINSPQALKIVDKMLRVAHGQRKNKKRSIMVGLAAPQIGISKRIILVDVKANGKDLPAGRQGKVGDLRVYINPQITWASKKEGEWYEGCYSTGKVCGIVSRSTSIKIRSFKLQHRIVNRIPIPDRKSEDVEEKWSGYVARIFQHEIDHLNGKRFPDLIKNPDHLHWVLKKEFPLYRNKQSWKNWPKKCSFEKWGRIKEASVFSQHDRR